MEQYHDSRHPEQHLSAPSLPQASQKGIGSFDSLLAPPQHSCLYILMFIHLPSLIDAE